MFTQVTAPVLPYQAAKVTNAVLTQVGLPTIPPQMLYNYTTARIRKGKKPLIEVTVIDGQAFIEPDVLRTWITKYVLKKRPDLAPKAKQETEVQLQAIEA